MPGVKVNGTEATRQCLMGGTDIDSGGTYRGNLAKAVESGELDVKHARLRLRSNCKMRMMMGLFDPDQDNLTSTLWTSSGRQSTLRWAWRRKEGMTLLKKGPLPFAPGKSIAVIGRAVNDTNSLTGNYDGPLCAGGGAKCFHRSVSFCNCQPRWICGCGVDKVRAAARRQQMR